MAEEADPTTFRTDFAFYENANKSQALKEFGKIVRLCNDDDVAIHHILFILSKLRHNVRENLAASLRERLPLRMLDSYAVRLASEGLLHSSYLYTLNRISYGGLGGAVIVDQLLQESVEQFLDEYLIMINPEEAEAFVELAVVLIDMTPAQIRDHLRRLPFFKISYLETRDVAATFHPSGIADLVVKVCQVKSLVVPAPFRKIRVENFFHVIFDEFKSGKVDTGDFLSVVREALRRSDLGGEIAIGFFRDRIPEVAEFFALKAGLPKPLSSEDVDPKKLLTFNNAGCHGDHLKYPPEVKDAEQIVICNALTLLAFREELRISECVAITHHEPPRLFPQAHRMDMLSVRTLNKVFHVLLIPTPDLMRQVIKNLRNYLDKGFIYTRSPHGMLRIFHEEYGWEPEVYDVKHHLEHVTGKQNSSFSDLVRVMFNRICCSKGEVFSAHVKPSSTALVHRGIQLSTIYFYGIGKVGAHKMKINAGRPPGGEGFGKLERMVKEDEVLEEERRRLNEEEEKRKKQAENRKRSAEKKRQEAEENRQLREEEERRRRQEEVEEKRRRRQEEEEVRRRGEEEHRARAQEQRLRELEIAKHLKAEEEKRRRQQEEEEVRRREEEEHRARAEEQRLREVEIARHKEEEEEKRRRRQEEEEIRRRGEEEALAQEQRLREVEIARQQQEEEEKRRRQQEEEEEVRRRGEEEHRARAQEQRLRELEVAKRREELTAMQSEFEQRAQLLADRQRFIEDERRRLLDNCEPVDQRHHRGNSLGDEGGTRRSHDRHPAVAYANLGPRYSSDTGALPFDGASAEYRPPSGNQNRKPANGPFRPAAMKRRRDW